MATFDSNRDAKANVGIQGTIIVEDEGGVVGGGPHTTLDFVGAGVTATDAGGGTATITIPGGGSGTDTYTAPNEYYVDPSLAVDATKRQYQTVEAALTAAGSSTNQVVVRLVEGVNHLWDGSGLDPSVSLSLYSAGTSTLQFEETSTVSTSGSVLLRHLNIESRGIAATGTFTVVTAPLAIGDEVDVNGFIFTGVGGARTSGDFDWDSTLGTTALLAAEIADAINDPANGGSGAEFGHGTTATVVGSVITITVDIPGTEGNSYLISATTTPGGGITVVNMAGGLDTTLNFETPRLGVEDCSGSLLFGMPADPSSAYKTVLLSRSNLDLQVYAGDDTLGGEFEIDNCIIRTALNGLIGSLWYHDAATTEWSLTARKTLFNIGAVDPDPVITANLGLLNTSLQDVTMVLYNNFGSMVVQSGGNTGTLRWESSRVLEGGLLKSGGGFLFGDLGDQYGLEIEYQTSNGYLPVDAPDGTVARSQTEDGGNAKGIGQVTFSGDLLQWRGANNSVMLGGETISSNGVPTWLTTVTEGDFLVNITDSSALGIYSVRGQLLADSGTVAQSSVWDIDALLRIDSSPALVNIISGATPVLKYETAPGQFSFVFGPAGDVEVVNTPVTPGVTLTINGVPLTAVAGARTPGSDDFDGSLGTTTLIAAEIADAINDAANSFVGVAIANSLGGRVTVASLASNLTLAETGSDLALRRFGLSLIVTRNSGSSSTRLSADFHLRSARIFP